MKTKSYAAKSSVKRAAKGMEGFNLENLQVLQDEEGKWYGTDEAAEEENLDTPPRKEMGFTGAGDTVPAEDVDLINTYGVAHCPSCGTHLSNGIQTDSNMRADTPDSGCDKFEYLCLACNHEFGPAIQVAEAKPQLNKSTVKKPCVLVWEIADQMEGAKRKEVLAACVDAGVAFYTARTQYQQWLTSKRKDREAAAKA